MKFIKPSFFIIGAAKAGTTSLAQHLSRHPAIYIPPKKELLYFNYQALSAESVNRYENFFHTDKNAELSGESSPQYSFGATYPYCAARIAEYRPDAKIIYIVRDPVIRMQSHILQIRNWGGAYKESVAQIIEKYPQVVEASMYGARLKDYLQYFKRQQILVIQFEKMLAEGPGCISRVCEFLEVEPPKKEEFTKKNSSINHFEDRKTMQILRRIGLGQAGTRIPPSIKKHLIHLFKKRQTETPQLGRDEVAALKAIFRQDTALLSEDWEIDQLLWSFEPKPFDSQESKTNSSGYESIITLD